MMQFCYKKIIQHTLLCMCTFFVATAVNAVSLDGIKIYQKDLHTSPERQQNLADDIDRYRNADDMWEILRNDFALNHYEDNPLVQAQIDWFMDHQDFLRHSADRAGPYLYFIYQQAKKRHLPPELVLLPMIESSYNPFAYSTAGASGIWQMMPGTATGYGIKQDWWYDGRRDVIASTNAALNYLSYLGNFFETNWLLAIAAYDTGEGNVMSALNRNIRDGATTDYWSLPLAQETRIYVPRLLALATIIAHPERYPVYFPPVRNAPYLAQVDIGAQIDLNHAAGLAGLTFKKLMQLNPGYNRATTSPNGPFKLVLPIENVAQFTDNLDRLPLYQQVIQHAAWRHYKVKPGDTLAGIAQQFNTSPSEVRKSNFLSSNTVRPGSNLIIPYTVPSLSKTILAAEKEQKIIIANDEKTSVKIAENKRMARLIKMTTRAARSVETTFKTGNSHYQLQDGDTVYMTRSGDDLNHIAQHFHTTSLLLQAVNHLTDNKTLQAGDKLIIPTHIKNTQFASVEHQKYQLSSGDTIYIVRAGDTMEKIASKYHSSPPAIRVANLLASNHLQDGDRLIIPTHL